MYLRSSKEKLIIRKVGKNSIFGWLFFGFGDLYRLLMIAFITANAIL